MDITSVQGFGQQASTSKKQASSEGVKGEYAQLLQQKLSTLKQDLEEMEQRREELDELRKQREELTGKTEEDENGNISTQGTKETLKRFMPDGTILVTTTENGKVVEQFKKKPNMVPMPNPSAPKPEDGGTASQQIKWMPHYSVMDLLSVK